MVEKREQALNVGMLILGIILLGTGVLFLAANFLTYLSVAKLWPLFMLIPVAVLLAVGMQYKDKLPAVILPVIILTFYCGYFLWLNFTSWSYAATTWPNFLIGPGLGFLVLYLITHKSEFLIPTFIMFILSASFYGALLGNTLIVAILMMSLGVVLVLSGLIKGKQKDDKG